MAWLLLLATQRGRIGQPANVLVFAAAFMVLLNPFILLWDIGFQLSFLSILGLGYIAPIGENYAGKLGEFPGIKKFLLPTLAAIIATLPLLLYQFGQMSLVAPLVNILILWLIPPLMIAGAMVVLMSFIFFPLANAAGALVYLGMKYIIAVVQFFSSLPL